MGRSGEKGRLHVWALFFLGGLFAVFFALDWYRFANDIGEETLWRVGKVLKLLFTTTCAAFVILRRNPAVDRADWIRLSVAFLIVFLGDLFFFLGLSMPAVGVFTLAQLFITIRNAAGFVNFFKHGIRANLPRAIVVGLCIIALDIVIIAVAFRDFLMNGGLFFATVGVVYALFLTVSVWVAWMTPAVQRFAPAKAATIAVAMTLFYFCDVTVGLGGVYEGTTIGSVARNLTWLFYAPSLVLLVSSGLTQDR